MATKTRAIFLHMEKVSDNSNRSAISHNHWTFNGINAVIFQSKVGSLHFTMQHTSLSYLNMVENPRIILHNSSFGSLDLHQGTQGEIIDCHINAELLHRPTLITTKNAKLKILNGIFTNFKAIDVPAVLHGELNSSITIDQTTISNNRANFGVIVLHDNCTLNMSDVKIKGNKAKQGLSALTFWNDVKVTKRDSNLDGNVGSSGGVILALNRTSIQSFTTSFSKNSATTGGAILAQGRSFVSLVKCKMIQNSAKHSAIKSRIGSLHKKSSFPAVVTKSYKTDTHASRGGAILVEFGSNLTVRSSRFLKNKAQTAGGAVAALHRSSVDISNVNFIENFAGEGGAIYVKNESKINKIVSCDFKGNKASNGAAIHVNDQAEISIISSYFENNNASNGGGCISASRNVKASISLSDFSKNIAKKGGTAEVIENSFMQFRKCEFNLNKVLENGGVVFVYQSSVHVADCDFLGNNAENGGAVFATTSNLSYTEDNPLSVHSEAQDDKIGNVRIRISQCIFTKNSANQGGAIMIQARSGCKETLKDDHSADLVAKLDIRNSQFKENSGTIAGGALSGCGQLLVQISKSNFTRHHAGMGGVVHMTGEGLLKVKDSNFIENKCTYVGGAINLIQKTRLNVTKCVFYTNVALRGASIAALDHVTIYIQDADFTDNTAQLGGSLHVAQTGVVLIRSSRFVSKCPQNIAIAMKDNITSDIFDSMFAFNMDYMHAGALRLQNNVTCNIYSCFFGQNSGREAGAIYVKNRVTLYITNSSFAENSISSSENDALRGEEIYKLHY